MSSKLRPTQAAKLAKDVYDVTEGSQFKQELFLKNAVFTSKKSSKLSLTAVVGGRLLLKTKDAFGICALGGKGFEEDMFIVLRGTTSGNKKADWITDASCGLTHGKTGHLVHVGFNQTFNSMLPSIQDFLTKNIIKGTIHIIGHSLGGAVAALAADWIKKEKGITVKLYTFGAPRVGTHFFVKSTTEAIGAENMYRVHHKTDPVPMVALFPFTQAPYNSHGHFVDSSELVLSGAAHKMDLYKKSAAKSGDTWQGLKGVPAQAYDVDYAIEQWLQSKALTTTESPAFFRWAESALMYVLKKLGMTLAVGVQALAMGVSTLADKLAYILAKGLDLADNMSIWVEHLMRRLMQALGMKTAKSKEELTRGLIRSVLARLIRLNYENAKRAIRKI